MTEREIRNAIAEVCAELDRRARSLLVPSILGAGLMLGGCGDRDKPVDGGVNLPYMAPRVDARVEGPIPLYAPPPIRDGRIERGTIPPYMAPDVVAPPQPEYIAPAPDGGASTLYSAPGPDLK